MAGRLNQTPQTNIFRSVEAERNFTNPKRYHYNIVPAKMVYGILTFNGQIFG